MKVTIRYAVQYEHKELTLAEARLVWTLTNQVNAQYNHNIASIKFIRDQYGLGLKEAKDIVDSIKAARKDVFFPVDMAG